MHEYIYKETVKASTRIETRLATYERSLTFILIAPKCSHVRLLYAIGLYSFAVCKITTIL